MKFFNFLKISRKTFTTTDINKTALTKELFFKYQGIEYRSKLPEGVEISVQDFLNKFTKDAYGKYTAPDRSNTHKDFEIFKNGKYIPWKYLISEIPTATLEKNPLTVVDSTLTLDNIKFRGINHLRDGFNTHSNTLQLFLNSFLNKYSVNKENLATDDIQRLIKAIKEVKNTSTKFNYLISSILSKIALGERKRVSYFIKQNEHYDLNSVNFNDIKGIFVLESVINNCKIPVTIVNTDSFLAEKDNNLLSKEMNKALVTNLDLVRKLAIKNNLKYNFGVVTNLYKWKINLYRRPEEKSSLETENDYLTSLQYDLHLSDSHVDLDTFSILLKILKGLIYTTSKDLEHKFLEVSLIEANKIKI